MHFYGYFFLLSASISVFADNMQQDLTRLAQSLEVLAQQQFTTSAAEDDSFLATLEAAKKPGVVDEHTLEEVLKKFNAKRTKRKDNHIGLSTLVFTGKRTHVPFEDGSYIEKMTQRYKMHLMPRLEDLPRVLYMILREAQQDKKFGACIGDLKFATSYEKLLINKQYVPLIVIYVETKTCAQLVLDRLYKLLGHLPGSGYAARFSEKVTDLLWFAQGDGDHKNFFSGKPDRLAWYYAGPDWAYFKPYVTGKKQDYHLINPALQIKRPIPLPTENYQAMADMLKKFNIRMQRIAKDGYFQLISPADGPSTTKPIVFKGKDSQLPFVGFRPNEGAEEEKYVQEVAPYYYEIYLMPEQSDLLPVLERLLAMIQKNSSLSTCISNIKFSENYVKYKENNCFPLIVILIHSPHGSTCAQKVLDAVYEEFKQVNGTECRPWFGEKITNLIYFGQGEGEHKRLGAQKYYEFGFAAYLKPRQQAFVLKNPAKRPQQDEPEADFLKRLLSADLNNAEGLFEKWFGIGFDFNPHQGYFHVQSDPLQFPNDIFLGTKPAPPSMKNTDYLQKIVNFYKIHLMPQPKDVLLVVYRILNTAQHDKTFAKCLQHLKFNIKISKDEFASGAYMPMIVVYAAEGKACAQKLIDTFYILLNDLPGLAADKYPPRYSKRITNMLWFAQGDGDHKKMPDNKKYYEQPDMVYFKHDVLGLTQDYHLVHPATGKRL